MSYLREFFAARAKFSSSMQRVEPKDWHCNANGFAMGGPGVYP
jgi:hypothetical protein